MDPPVSLWEHCLDTAALSDIGLRRRNNQDAMAVVLARSQEQWDQRGHLFVVADGMGAHAAGELASKLAADTVPLVYHKLTDRPPMEALLSAVVDANHQINTRGSASEDFRGMGTTVTTLAILPEGALVAHVGDSRAYRLRGNQFEQLTFDHSLVWELRAAGQIPTAEAQSHIPKNIITRSLGPNREVQVDLEGPFPIQFGDTFLLCSDGLSGQVKDDEIGKLLAALPPKEAARALVDLANLRGGPDNITVVVVRVTAGQVAKATKSQSASSQLRLPRRPIHPAVWGLLGLFFFAGVALGVTGYWVPAIASLAAGILTGAIALVRRSSESEPEASELRGRAPYGSWDAAADLVFVTELAKVAQQLRDAAARADWQVDWLNFNTHEERAIAATREGQYQEAVREYCRAVMFLMEQLRHQRERLESD